MRTKYLKARGKNGGCRAITANRRFPLSAAVMMKFEVSRKMKKMQACFLKKIAQEVGVWSYY
jgi:hypothetical protein